MRYLVFLIVLVFSAGCGPKYVVKNQYIAPRDASGLACTNTCARDKALCLQTCQTTYQVCEQDAYNRAKDISNLENLKYDKAYTSYLYELKVHKRELFLWQQIFDKKYMDFSYFTSKCEKDRDKFACARGHELRDELGHMKRNKPLKPTAPHKPRYADIYNQELQQCSKSCNCESIYDSCFVSCGGDVIPFRMCVSNCE